MDISVHCHDDLGMAVANYPGLHPGRRHPGGVHRQRHRRAGRQRQPGGDRHGASTPGRTSTTPRPASTPSRSTSPASCSPASPACPSPPARPSWAPTPLPTSPASTSTAFIANAQTYEIMTSTDVGIPQNTMVLGKHSGKHALRERLEDMGYERLRRASWTTSSPASRTWRTRRRTSPTPIWRLWCSTGGATRTPAAGSC